MTENQPTPRSPAERSRMRLKRALRDVDWPGAVAGAFGIGIIAFGLVLLGIVGTTYNTIAYEGGVAGLALWCGAGIGSIIIGGLIVWVGAELANSQATIMVLVVVNLAVALYTVRFLYFSVAFTLGGVPDMTVVDHLLVGARYLLLATPGVIAHAFSIRWIIRLVRRLSQARRAENRCPKCNYDLRGLLSPSGRRGSEQPGCPECGWGRPE